ncbi:MFS transporter [Rugamonas sp. CCM 8940]|nr:MFS transporter [Rugamonas sp. CCM 8940]
MSAAALFGLLFLPYAMGHFLSCLMRTVNAILVPQLTAELALKPAQLGLLSSVFYFAFALAQLPVGVALDRWGPQRVQPPMLLLAALGALAFAHGRNYAELLAARALIGLGLGGCFMSAVKAISTWIPPARLPTVHGCLIAVGGLGAAAATVPVRLALGYTDWHGVFIALAAAAAALALLIHTVTPAAPAPPRRPPSLRGLGQVYRHPAFRDTAALMLVPHMVFFGIQGLWIGRWLNDAARCSEAETVQLLYYGMAAIVVGAVAVGLITEWAGRRGVAPLDVAAVGVALFLLVQLGLVCNYAPLQRPLAVLFTLVGTVTGIEYTIIAQRMPAGLTGRAATCLNLLIFLGAFTVQAGFGLVLDLWPAGAGHRYPAAAYQSAFGLLFALQLPGLLRFLALRRGGRAASGRMACRPPRAAL